jgi:hypothetical protein
MDNTSNLKPVQNNLNSQKDDEWPRPDSSGSGLEESLPCLYRNNSTEINEKALTRSLNIVLRKDISLEKKYRKTATALSYNVQEFSHKYGLENLGFLTLTFKDHVTDFKESSKRFNSLATNILNTRYQAWLKVSERCKNGRIHYHLIIALHKDVRTGFDFSQVKQQIYSSANKYLKSEWSFWRSTAPKYNFGRTELLPIKSSHEAIGRYVGKYIGKHMMNREMNDKGARLVSYSKGCRTMTTKFSWYTEGSAQWRNKVKTFAYMISDKTGCEPTFEGLREQLGSKWAYNHREFILNLPI